MTDFFRCRVRMNVGVVAAALLVQSGMVVAQSRLPPPSATTTADFIVAVVNQDVVTYAELQQRMARIQESAAREKTALPDLEELQRQVLDVLVSERVQITHARENGPRIDEAEIDRAVQGVALQNQLTLPQLRERLQREGVVYARLRNDLRDQLMMERVREREVNARIRISNEEVEAEMQRRLMGSDQLQLNVAQILVPLPNDGVGSPRYAQQQARAEAALARVKAGEAFDVVAKEVSEDGNREKGGVIGLRPANRLPDPFVAFVRDLKPGEVADSLLVTPAGFHVLKLLERSQAAASALTAQQTRVRHILLRTSARLPVAAATKRLGDFKQQILSGKKSFEQIAGENSEDSSAQRGGDLGWVSPGTLVPEFEDAMNALDLKGMSEPVVSRFGVHLLQVLDRREIDLDAKQQREQIRNLLREKKFEEAYSNWLNELRSRAYVELRELPLLQENAARPVLPVKAGSQVESAR